jgi:hypothetical protein
VNTVLTASGEPNTASFIPLGQNSIVNASPSVREQRSMIQVGASTHRSVWASAGIRGLGGSPGSVTLDDRALRVGVSVVAMVVIEHVTDCVFDGVLGVGDRVSDPGGDRVGEEDRDDPHGGDRERQAGATGLPLRGGRTDGKR